jgi:hypothetical protein
MVLALGAPVIEAQGNNAAMTCAARDLGTHSRTKIPPGSYRGLLAGYLWKQRVAGRTDTPYILDASCAHCKRFSVTGHTVMIGFRSMAEGLVAAYRGERDRLEARLAGMDSRLAS